MEIEAVVSKLPSTWHGLLGAMATDTATDQLETAELWYLGTAKSQYGYIQGIYSTQVLSSDRVPPLKQAVKCPSLNWSEFISALCQTEPKRRGKCLVFVPRLFCLPTYIQKTMLSFLYIHLGEMMPTDRTLLSKALKSQYSDNCWLSSLTHQLVVKCLPNEQEKQIRIEDLFSERNHNRAYELAKRLQVESKENLGNEHSQWQGFEKAKGNYQIESEKMETDFQRNERTAVVMVTIGDDAEIVTEESESEPPKKKLNIGQTENQSLEDIGILSANDLNDIFPPTQFVTQMSSQLVAMRKTLQTEEEIEKSVTQQVSDILLSQNNQVEDQLTLLELGDIPEHTLATIGEQICEMGPELSYKSCTEFVRCTFVPKVMNMKQNASRILNKILLEFTKTYPKQLIEGLVMPLMERQLTTESHHSDIIARMVRDGMNQSNRQMLLQKILESSFHWGDLVVAVIQVFVNIKLTMEHCMIKLMSDKIEQNSSLMTHNLQFGKLVLSFVNKYGIQIAFDERISLQEAMSYHKTFLKKSVESALKKLNTS